MWTIIEGGTVSEIGVLPVLELWNISRHTLFTSSDFINYKDIVYLSAFANKILQDYDFFNGSSLY